MTETVPCPECGDARRRIRLFKTPDGELGIRIADCESCNGTGCIPEAIDCGEDTWPQET